MKRHIERWLFGYRPGVRSALHTNGWSFGTDTRRGRLAASAYGWLTFELLDLPRRLRFRLADHLARAALRLRGEAPYRFGYFDDQEGNRAAELQDSIEWDLINSTDWQDPEQVERFGEQRDRLRELATLARATSYRSWRARP